jgi:hypothetical protein
VGVGISGSGSGISDFIKLFFIPFQSQSAVRRAAFSDFIQAKGRLIRYSP